MDQKKRRFSAKTVAALFILLLATALLSFLPTNGSSEETDDILENFYKSVSYDPDAGRLQFTIPESIPGNCKFYLHVSGRIFMGDSAGGMSFHAFDNESENSSWIAGKTYELSLRSENLDYGLLVFGLIEKDNENEENLYQITVHSDGTKKIKKAKKNSESFAVELQPNR